MRRLLAEVRVKETMVRQLYLPTRNQRPKRSKPIQTLHVKTAAVVDCRLDKTGSTARLVAPRSDSVRVSKNVDRGVRRPATLSTLAHCRFQTADHVPIGRPVPCGPDSDRGG